MANFMSRDDIQALRDYVRAPGNFGANQAESTVLLHVTHSNLKAEFMELRLDRHATIDSLKLKLCFHCGSNPSAMILQLKSPDGSLVATLNDDSKKLGFYSPDNGHILHVIDTDPTSASANGWLEDTSKVAKYVMSDEAYRQRENTYYQYKADKLKQDPAWTLEREMAERRGVPYVPPAAAKEKVTDEEHMADLASKITIGDRCQVLPGDKRGVVAFVGKVNGLPMGWWIGVHYDEPVGKNDGSIKGKKYFTCPMGYGAFLRPDKVQVGNFPELDLLGSDDEI